MQMNVRLCYGVWRGSLGKLSFFRGNMVDFSAYLCGIFLIIDIQNRRMVLITGYNLKCIEKPSHTMYNEVKSTNVEKCEKINIDLKTLFHKKSKLRGCYNIYKLTRGKNKFYLVEHYNCKDSIYDYEVFDDLEDALVYIS